MILAGVMLSRLVAELRMRLKLAKFLDRRFFGGGVTRVRWVCCKQPHAQRAWCITMLKSFKVDSTRLMRESIGSGRPVLEASFKGIDGFMVEREALFPIMADCRAVRYL